MNSRCVDNVWRLLKFRLLVWRRRPFWYYDISAALYYFRERSVEMLNGHLPPPTFFSFAVIEFRSISNENKYKLCVCSRNGETHLPIYCKKKKEILRRSFSKEFMYIVTIIFIFIFCWYCFCYHYYFLIFNKQLYNIYTALFKTIHLINELFRKVVIFLKIFFCVTLRCHNKLIFFKKIMFLRFVVVLIFLDSIAPTVSIFSYHNSTNLTF